MKKSVFKKVALGVSVATFLTCCVMVAGVWGYEAPVRVAEAVAFTLYVSGFLSLFLAV